MTAVTDSQTAKMPKKKRNTKRPCYTDADQRPPKKALAPAHKMNSVRRIPSDFLVARPSFASGFARLVDFGCTFDAYNRSTTPEEADTRAMLADWIAVGFDIVDALDLIEEGRKIA